MRIYEPPAPAIPLPVDVDGVLVWRRSPWRTLSAEARGRGIDVEYRDGTDGGRMRTSGATRILDVLREMYR